MADAAKKPLAVIALGLGKPKPASDEEGGSYDDDFESAAGDAFPELKDDPDRMAAFKQAVMACMDRSRGAEEREEGEA